MSDENQDDQALADEWAAALEESGDSEDDAVNSDDIIDQATPAAATPEVDSPTPTPETSPPAADFPNLQDENSIIGDGSLDMILDIPVTIAMELGRTKISIKNLLQLNQGSVVELDRLAGEPMDVLVNNTLVAHGEVVVVNEKFGIRLTDVVSTSERVKNLN
ncbi:MAG: flagellar motor switch protein FliN [Gammaproteobacteria bacterium]|nr:flagellar motor switch protein FliN [Gammaproteobacteria bacterium]